MIFFKETGCLTIYWLRFTHAFRLEAGIRIELFNENPSVSRPEASRQSFFVTGLFG